MLNYNDNLKKVRTLMGKMEENFGEKKTDTNLKKVSTLLGIMEENFGEKKTDDFKKLVITTLKKEFGEDAYLKMIEVFNYILKTRVYKKFPTIAEFFEAYKKLNSQNDDSIERLALQGFNKFWSAINEAGVYATVVFDDVVINTVIKIQFQGWINACMHARDEYKAFWQRDFIKAYKLYYQDKENLGYFKLKGITEKNNDTLEFGKSRFNIKYFGDIEKCKEIDEQNNSYLPENVKVMIQLKSI